MNIVILIRFYGREKSLYVAWACFRNDSRRLVQILYSSMVLRHTVRMYNQPRTPSSSRMNLRISPTNLEGSSVRSVGRVRKVAGS